MSVTRILYSLAFFALLFVFQESAISLLNLPVGGFSLYLAVAIASISLEEGNGAIIMAFIAGIILDLSPSSNAPFGQWAFILTVIGFLISANRETIADISTTPLFHIALIGITATIALIAYLLFGSLIGEANGSFAHDLATIGINALWTILATPIFLPTLQKFRNYSLTSKERW